MSRIGVVAFQGAFKEHIRLLETCGVEGVPVRSGPLEDLDGLILPGGESTVIGRHLQSSGLDVEIRKLVAESFPVLATCAGAILMVRSVEGTEPGGRIGLVPVSAERNGFGPQIDSFQADLEWNGEETIQGVFIRAPRFHGLHEGVETLAHFGNEPVALQWKNVLLTSFHPELTGDTKLHRHFLEQCVNRYKTHR